MNDIHVSASKPSIQIEDGKYGAILCQIIQLGSQRFEKDGREWFSPQVLLGFELPELQFETKDGPMSTLKSGTYFLSLNESRNGQVGLREILNGFRGTDEWTEEELEDFTIRRYLGKACLLTVAAVESKGKTYSNITAVEQAPEGLEKVMERRRPEVFITVADFANLETFDIPSWIKDKIMTSQEYQELVSHPAPVNEQYAPENEGPSPAFAELKQEMDREEIKIEI